MPGWRKVWTGVSVLPDVRETGKARTVSNAPGEASRAVADAP